MGRQTLLVIPALIEVGEDRVDARESGGSGELIQVQIRCVRAKGLHEFTKDSAFSPLDPR